MIENTRAIIPHGRQKPEHSELIAEVNRLAGKGWTAGAIADQITHGKKWLVNQSEVRAMAREAIRRLDTGAPIDRIRDGAVKTASVMLGNINGARLRRETH